MTDPTPPQTETVDPVDPSLPTVPASGTAVNPPRTPSGTEPREGASPPPAESVPVEAAPAPLLAIPGYEILHVLGRGGMGVVYKARETALDRLVALKVVVAGAHASPEQLGRFRIEARAEARLQHPNIVQVYAVGEHGGFPYLALEHVDGGNLAQKIARRPQPPREAARLIGLLARAMAYAHHHGIIHRDLKPANILLQKRFTTNHTNDTNENTKENGKRLVERGELEADSASAGSYSADSCDSWFLYVPKIADFGLAKRLEEQTGQTRSGHLMGTPTYMSPEQAEGRVSHVGPAADIWALGVILYELLVGRPPFQGVTLVETLEQVRTREPVPPTQLQPKVPADLETICLKCLRKEPGRRYTTAEALAEDLRRFLAGEPIVARPVGAPERLARWCRRNPRLAGLSAAVLLLLVTLAAGSTAFAFVLDARRRETDLARQEAERNAEAARKQEERADENARVALDRQRLALDALRVVIDKVQKDLKAVPATAEVRRDILEAAMRVLREAVARNDSSGLPERGLASAQMILADILWERNRHDEALEHYNACHAILKALYEANPDSDKDAGNFAASLSRQGDLALDCRNDAAEALALYRRALRLQEESLAHPPPRRELTPTEIRRSIANSHQRLGEILLRTDPENPAESEDHFQKARDLLEEVVRAEGTTPHRQRLAEVAFKLAVVEEKMNRPEPALRAYDVCLAMRKKLVADNPADVRCKLDLFDLCGKVGDQALFRGDTATAQRYYREAIGPNEQLAQGDKQPGVRKLLGLNYYRLATACLRLGEAAAADENYKKCLDVRVRLQKEIPNNVGLQIDLMIAQARRGLHAEATAFARKLRERFPKNPDYLFQSACGYALSASALTHGKSEGALTSEERALRQRYLDSAVEALRQAKANGYKDVKSLQVDPDLDPLRADGGFQALVREYMDRTAGSRK